jgi:hypothetical protein
MKRSTTKQQTPPDSHKPSPGNRGHTGWTRFRGSGHLSTPVQTTLSVVVVRESLSKFDRAAKAESPVVPTSIGGSYSLPGNVVAVHGLGQSAYYYPRGVGSLRVWQHGYAIEFQPGVRPTPYSRMRGLALTALKHL